MSHTVLRALQPCRVPTPTTPRRRACAVRCLQALRNTTVVPLGSVHVWCIARLRPEGVYLRTMREQVLG